NANISETQAALRADVIYNAVGVFSDKFNLIAQQIEGLNYNGFVKLYNAFGNRGVIFMIKDDKNLIDFLQSNLSNYEFNQLSFLLNGAFF
ncbi:hypothetical protein U2044_15355, partial [Listeria monocytogenes]|uniref:hypothetical protein n=1 Tax=Listeria monocytogenes TaxID=1639 RepID=UPI002FDC3290